MNFMSEEDNMARFTTSNSFNLPVEAKILGARKKTVKQVARTRPILTRRRRNSLKQSLLGLASAAVLAAMTPSMAFAQNNDVDAYDGSVNSDCDVADAITAAPSDGRNGNDVSGRRHCIGTSSDNWFQCNVADR